ncbi:phosphatase PAP2 family protein [Herminiimonas arsenitoxidans]|uniref:phosphatase PAP2 family protein n=1 Tax=Herminiimonas arsenitoxidans TaxID=1809410 RepID=UPI0012FFB086|nr:phosphatase PAP2 family protein [Herminiimonas arsenitoxidans]
MNQTDEITVLEPYTDLRSHERQLTFFGKTYLAKNVTILLGIAFPLFLFLALAIDIKHGVAYALDTSFLLTLHSYATPLLDLLALKISAFVTLFSLLVLAFLAFRRQWRIAFFWLLAVGGSAILNSLAKHLFERVRPALWTLVAPESTFSFPSGHAMQAMTIALTLIILLRASRYIRGVVIASAGFVLLVGLCRMYLGLHYPSDIVASYLLSITWVSILITFFSERYYTPLAGLSKR